MKDATNSPFDPQTLVKRGLLAGYVTRHMFSKLTDSQIEYWEKHKTELGKKLSEVFEIIDVHIDARRRWEQFYKSEFGWTVNFGSVVVPIRPSIGQWRLIFIAKGMTLGKVFKAWKFEKFEYSIDLDKELINKRTAAEHYAVWILAGDEPDEKYLNMPVEKADPIMEIGMTLLERMILESYHFAITGKHLDMKGATICSGSRHADGRVPFVAPYSDGAVRVNWLNLDAIHDGYGIREAIRC